ncbi:MAG: ferritin-like domain-containing protein [Verrucomicrobiota bacterium]
MGTKGKAIVKVDVKKLLDLLNQAYADEWLAYYQYWIGAKVAQGRMRGIVVSELMEHAADELRHAEMLAERILQLGGMPVTSPEKWYKVSGCGYDEPTNPNVKALVEQNIRGEQCAISVYKKLVDFTEGKDHITYDMVLSILKDEVEHEDDLQMLQEDMQAPMK